MKLLWLCNMAPGLVKQTGKKSKKGGLWMDHVLADLLKKPELQVMVLYPSSVEEQGQTGERFRWQTFSKVSPLEVSQEHSRFFGQVIRDWKPDVVHIWGTEYGHSLAMMEACREAECLHHTVISIQGLVGSAGRHFTEGIPEKVLKGNTLRDFLKQDNLLHQQKVFLQRGEHENQALALACHVIGRTDWDRRWCEKLAPEAKYHFCNETLRQEFYQDFWEYDKCQKHRIFASNRMYSIKGFHYLLEALRRLLPRYPDAVVAIPGKPLENLSKKTILKEDSYGRYLRKFIENNHLHGHVEYLGSLDGEEMKQQYRKAQVFVLPSTIENSSNSLGEAMLLGVPTVAAAVGGIPTMLKDGSEGLLYPRGDVEALTKAIEQIFEMDGKELEAMGGRARGHGLRTHDPEDNLRQLLSIYDAVAGKDDCQ